MKKILLIAFIIIFAGVAGFGIYFYVNLNKKGNGEEKDFIVRSGQSTREIADSLQEEGLITSATVFTYYAKMRADLIQVGVYKISASQSIKEILAVLNSGKTSEDIATIPEGWRVTQIDDFLYQKKIIQKGALLQIASANEGFLFPDTYRFLPNTKPEEIRQEMLDNFNKKTTDLKVKREDIILASIVEREAKFDEDRAKIARVYLNRLAQNMKLQADPTIQYAKGSWDPITVSDYKNVDSPYNTYLNFGLPPGPICNPGLKSIEAALHPANNDYLYFFHGSNGRAVFSNTLQEHETKLKQAE
ncbi:MAG: Aminodeoxychorismate lyase [Berkelbacteria bacterium GW2011_GWA1_36_9]|uniref:Endolytic murein transglycosylase n=1 Tax=Berkelbacteria bacterium GW2011_GWA1_36_9 TaxID=1618331 RepID=A0A0G0FG10_9BACT|nr:MAG: Aminodeoxychorismate lyase [Berkelbacteria bacterium GW2011_GWA1_36_9]